MTRTQGLQQASLANALIVDALDGIRTMSDLAIVADEYRAEGYDVFFALNPTTGRTCLWRNLA